jgi:hypothetical protein
MLAAGNHGNADAHHESVESEEQSAAEGEPTTTKGRGKRERQHAGSRARRLSVTTRPIEAP